MLLDSAIIGSLILLKREVVENLMPHWTFKG